MEILGYFLRHPDAADSLEGIARWRLVDEVIHRKVDETQTALAWLVQKGLLLENSFRGEYTIFRLNPDRAAETKKALAKGTLPGLATQDSEMPSTLIDSMDNAAPWSALAPDGVTRSTEISLTVDGAHPRPGGGPQEGKIAGSANSVNHVLRRSLTPLDLTNFDEIRLWTYSDRVADGSPARPLFLELRLASAALPLANPGNTWRRYLPVTRARVWEPVRFSIADLPPGIRSAVTQMQFRSASAGTAFQCYVDEIIAVIDHMIADVDAALITQLNNIFVLSGANVPAVLHSTGSAISQARPYFEVTHYDIVFSRERTDSTRPRGDFADNGYVLRPPGIAYELYYQVTAVANDRPSQALMIEFLLRALPARGELVVNGFGLPMESIVVYPFEQLGGVRSDTIPLFYRISTRQEIGISDVVAPVQTVFVEGDIPTS